MDLHNGSLEANPTTGRDGRRRRLAGMVLFAGLSITTLVVTVTGAMFSDTHSAGGNSFTTGDVEISTSPSSGIVSFTTPPMVPGDKVTAPVTVSNSGTVQLRYAVKSTTTENTLAAQLDLTVKTGVTTCTNAGFGTDGTVSYGPGDLGSTAGVNVIGDPAQGAQGGERTLNAAASEVLCLQVSLPLASGSAYEGLTTTATFDFVTEQTANN